MTGKWRARFFSFVFFILVFKIRACFSLNSEGAALLKFRMKMDSPSSRALSDWSYDDEYPCSWSGVRCVDGKVYMLDLHGFDLVGSLAPELGSLSHLEVLDLSKNRLSGSIPQELGLLSALQVLDLRDNMFTGKVPSELGGLCSLKHLFLSGNLLDGNLPQDIQKLGLPSDIEINGIVADGAGHMNRKLGGCTRQSFVGNSQKSDKVGNRALFLEVVVFHSSPESGNRNVDTQVKDWSARRVLLLSQDSRNLISLPPSNLNPGIQFNTQMIPSKSSGSFPAVPTSTKASPGSPTPSPGSESGSETATPSTPASQESSWISTKFLVGLSVGIFLVVVAASLLVVCRTRAVKTIRPWKSGLSGQLRKAFITGVPKLNRSELETACEDFSNIVINNEGVSAVYKGTLSNGVEIAVASTGITCRKNWSRRAEIVFRKQIDTLSRVNHKNFINLIGYCEEEEPFTRMMVFEYAPNGNLFEHLHVEDMEHLDWKARMRIAMGVAYCLQHMHDLNPSLPLFNLTSKCIFLTDDYAAKIGDGSFWEEFINNKQEEKSEQSELPPAADIQTNVYSFGILLLEIISGRLPYSEEDGHLINWASQYIHSSKQMSCLVDGSLKGFKENELGIISEVVLSCTQQDFRVRPTMKEVIEKLQQEIDITPAQAAPRSSPLWWAELEILSTEAA